MTTAVEQIKERSQQRRLESSRQYHELVVAVGRGDPVDPDHAEAAITAAGKSHDEFEADVRTIEQRLENLAIVERQPAVRKQLSAVNAQLRAKQETLRKMEQQINSECEPLVEETHSLQTEMAAIAEAEKQLRSTVIDPAVTAEIAAIAAERKRLSPLIAQIRERLHLEKNNLPLRAEAVAAAESELERLRNQRGVEERYIVGASQRVDRQKAEREANRSRVEQLEQRLDDLRDEYAALEQRAEAVRLKELQP